MIPTFGSQRPHNYKLGSLSDTSARFHKQHERAFTLYAIQILCLSTPTFEKLSMCKKTYAHTLTLPIEQSVNRSCHWHKQ